VSQPDSETAVPAIEARGLTKLYGDRAALRELDLVVPAGQKLVVFGPNGAGKTTLVRLLATLSRPTAGGVRLYGIDTNREPVAVRRLVSVVSHQTYLYDTLTLDENLQFYGRMYGVMDLEERVAAVLSLVRLESRRHERVGRLSRGLEQRAAIARALLHDPRILLLDEPETGLDPAAVGMLRDALDEDGGGRTLLYTTHNLEQGMALADRIIILDRGRMVLDAPRGDIEAGEIRKLYDRHTGIIR